MVKEWQKKYGPVVGLMFGSQPTVAVIGAQEVLEVFRREEFQGRPDTFNSRDRAFNQRLGKSCFIFCTNFYAFNTNYVKSFFLLFMSAVMIEGHVYRGVTMQYCTSIKEYDSENILT
jgi:hypothetical protein